MSAVIQPFSDVSRRARNALVEALGVVDAMRFLAENGAGQGNYTEDRKGFYADDSVRKIAAEIKARRAG